MGYTPFTPSRSPWCTESANKPGASLGGRRAARGDRDAIPPGPGKVNSLGPISRLASRGVEVRDFDRAEALGAGIPREAAGALHRHLGSPPRECAVQGIGVGEQGHVSGREFAGKAVGRCRIAFNRGRPLEADARAVSVERAQGLRQRRTTPLSDRPRRQ